MNLRHVDSQTLWDVATAAPVTWPTGSGAHVVFNTANGLTSDGSNLVPATHLLTITNDEGKAAVCYLEMAIRIVLGQTGTVNNSFRGAVFCEPYHGANKYAGDEFIDTHIVTKVTSTLVVAGVNQNDFAGTPSVVTATGFPNQVFGMLQGGGTSIAPDSFIIGNRVVATGERAHLLTPIGLLKLGDLPTIAGMQKIYVYLKSINGAVVPANFNIAGKIVAHLYEWKL